MQRDRRNWLGNKFEVEDLFIRRRSEVDRRKLRSGIEVKLILERGSCQKITLSGGVIGRQSVNADAPLRLLGNVVVFIDNDGGSLSDDVGDGGVVDIDRSSLSDDDSDGGAVGNDGGDVGNDDEDVSNDGGDVGNDVGSDGNDGGVVGD